MTTSEWDSHKAEWRALLSDILAESDLLPDDCDAMLSNLDLYVSDELDGIDVQDQHPDLWAHLLDCAECRAEYLSLRDLLQAEANGDVPMVDPPPAEPSFVADAWRLSVEPYQGRDEPVLQFVFAPGYLQRSLRPDRRSSASAAGAWRGRGAEARPDGGEPDTLLLSYDRETPGEELIVKLHARASEDGEAALLFLSVVGDRPPEAVHLSWGGRQWQSAVTPAGQATLGPVPLAELDRPAPSDAFVLRLTP